MAFFPLYFIMDTGYTNEVSVYKLYLLGATFRQELTSLPRQRHALSVTFGDTSPIGRGTGVPGHSALDAQGPIGRKRAGLAYGGSSFETISLVKLLRIQTAGHYCFRAAQALLVPRGPDRPANGSPFGGAGIAQR